MRACQEKLSNGEPCPKIVEEGKTLCRWHDPQDESWRKTYELLKKARPEQKRDIVLALQKEHPEHRLVLSEREGQVADLQGINLRGANLDRADLRGADLEGANLKNASLRFAQLQHANLQGSNLEAADLTNANLSLANLRSAILSQANLEWATLQNTNLQNAKLFQAKLFHAQLGEADCQNANLESANIQYTFLVKANLQGAYFRHATLQRVNLNGAKLQGADLSNVWSMEHISLSSVWLDRTRMSHELLRHAIGEERDNDYHAAKLIYLALKQNFDDFGDYEAASWAYRKERRMERLEALKNWNFFKFFSDTLVEWLCDYGESVWRVVFWIAIFLFIIGPFLFSRLGGFVWPEDLSHDYFSLSSPRDRFWFSYQLYLLYTLDALTTASFSELRPSNNDVRLASGCLAMAGIVLAGLLGFVAGNRIRRS